jgi:hypothetical protein
MSRRYKILIAVVTVVLAAVIAQQVYAQVRKQQLMVEKLQNSQKILEGIATAKYDKIEKHANELVRISKTEEWLANKQPRYQQFTGEFQQAALKLAEKARAKNMDGVTLAYFDLTRSCVRCHQYLREVRDARLPGEHDKELAALLSHLPETP